jgi:hypothetical protein
LIRDILKQYSKKQLIVVSVGVLIFLLFVILSISVSQDRDRNVGTGPEYSDPSGPALLSNATQLYEDLADPAHYRAIAEDIGFFAQTNFIPLENNDSFVYNVKNYTIEGQELQMSGLINDRKEDFIVTVELLNFGKIKSTISAEGWVSVDDKLPSASKENWFIGSLPIENADFTIDYFTDSEQFVIQSFTTDETVVDRATKVIEDGLGRKLAIKESVFFAAIE